MRGRWLHRMVTQTNSAGAREDWVKKRYDGVGTVALKNSDVEIRRMVKFRNPADNWLKHVSVDGELKGNVVHERGSGELVLDGFDGVIYVPWQRKTNVVGIESSISGNHPMGRIDVKGSVELNPPNEYAGLPSWAQPYLSVGIFIA